MIPVRRLLLASLAVATAGCADGWRESVGLEVPPPDEFLVVSREPLTLPPSLDSLPPPQLGAPSRVERDPQQRARAALAGAGVSATASQSPGEAALTARAGPSDPAIREELRAQAQPSERRYGITSFLGYEIIQDPDAEGTPLQPSEETERLREAGAQSPVPPVQP
jgi:hypothetical protein